MGAQEVINFCEAKRDSSNIATNYRTDPRYYTIGAPVSKDVGIGCLKNLSITHTKSISGANQINGGAIPYSCFNHLATNSSPSSSSNLKVVEVVGNLGATESQLKVNSKFLEVIQ